MRRLALVVAALLLPNLPLLAQSGPDHDPTDAPGYTQNLFHHDQADSINLYNGQLTIPIAVGPSYPIGPKLKFQAMLIYNSTVWEYGLPVFPSELGLYYVIKADPSLGIGWNFSVGAIKACGAPHGSPAMRDICYVSPDGAEHLFDNSPIANYYKTSDTSQFWLHFISQTLGYEMWDGDGNYYVFDWLVSGFEDAAGNYIHDLGRGRNGWYARSISDPFGNAYTASYKSGLGSQPCWIASCPAGSANSYIIDTVKRGTTTLLSTTVNTDPGAPGVSNLLTDLNFTVPGGGVADWKIHHGKVNVARPQPNTTSLDLVTISSIEFPTTPSSSYSFLWKTGNAVLDAAGLIDTMTLPTGTPITYGFAFYNFYHGRAESLPSFCTPVLPPGGAPVLDSRGIYFPFYGGGPNISGTDCSDTNPNKWRDRVFGVSTRTETVGTVSALTEYNQWAFPYGEQGSPTINLGPQSLTLVTYPPDQDGKRAAMATLFWNKQNNGIDAGKPGSRLGADIRVAWYDHDPDPGFSVQRIIDQPLCGPGQNEDSLCATHATRVVTRTFQYDNVPDPNTGNRRLLTETTCYGATDATGATCGTAFSHTVTNSTTSTCGANHTTACTWEGNGRHYNKEAHSGSLINDGKTITTRWTPSNWAAAITAGSFSLPNLFNRRTETLSSTRDQYFYVDSASGFLLDAITWDSTALKVFARCATNDGAGDVATETTAILSSAAPPSTGEPWTTSPCASIVTSSIGTDGSTFGKHFTYVNGQKTKGQWASGAGTLSWPFYDVDRDLTTGLITRTRDTAGIKSDYSLDAVGRVTEIGPDGLAHTFVCYPSTTVTVAYRATASIACPTAGTEGGMLTWSHFDYDGLGRPIREKRRMPDSSISKRFTLFDKPGHQYFSSEWVLTGSSEAISLNIGTACVIDGGVLWQTARPSAAPGAYRMCYDPFSRPQQVVGANHSSLVTIDRSASTTSQYSVIKEAVTTWCVNDTLQTSSPWCATNGTASNSTTTTTRDAFGRITNVAEPTNDNTTYSYNVNDQVLSVGQGQTRNFTYDAFGFMKTERNPEKGSSNTTYTVGSLGNVLTETEPDLLAINRTFDQAGRLTKVVAGGSTYVVNCYDGTAPCGDTSFSNYGGTTGSKPAGKLSRRYGLNWIPTAGPTVDEQFDYNGTTGTPPNTTPIGTLSGLTTAVGTGDLNATTTQTWSYNNLGLVSSYTNPGALTANTTYASGFPTVISTTSPTQNVVTAATYNRAGGLNTWTAGNTGGAVTTTITPDASLVPRPGRIFATVGYDSGTFGYDGAGNVLSMPTDQSTFTYDSRSRLTSATYGGVLRNFAYDRYGNLTTNGPQSWTVDTATNHITLGSFGTPQYDGRGNLTSYSGETMSYDSLDRIYYDSKGGTEWSYLYSGAGERMVRISASTSVLRREMARLITEANIKAVPRKTNWAAAPVVCNGISFTNPPCSDNDANYIQTLYTHGVAAGCSGTDFCPDAALNRAQMAVFVVKGYQADGAPTPACSSPAIFTDVSCSDPTWGIYAPFIEQLSRDNVTAGCQVSPPKFCPGNPVTEWQILVWLSKAPTLPGGGTWATYRPVPRQSTYTLRDEQNRVVTEASDNMSGTQSAQLTYTRLNVYFGNFMVASYDNTGAIATPPVAADWWFSVSDHLGSPRYLFNKNRTKSETHKYWPYGEDTNTTPPVQRIGFTLMERDAETNRLYDHARHHEFTLGRFVTPDKRGGRASDPQSWSRYTYSRSNPVKLLDPNGGYFILATENDRQRFAGVLAGASADSKGRAIIQNLARDSRPVLLQSGHLMGDTEPVNLGVKATRLFGLATPIAPFTPGGSGLVSSGAIITVDFDKIAAVSSRSAGSLDSAGVITGSHELAHVDTQLNEGIGAAVQEDSTGSTQDFGEGVLYFPDSPDQALSLDEASALIASPDGSIQRPPEDPCGSIRVCFPMQ